MYIRKVPQSDPIRSHPIPSDSIRSVPSRAGTASAIARYTTRLRNRSRNKNKIQIKIQMKRTQTRRQRAEQRQELIWEYFLHPLVHYRFCCRPVQIGTSPANSCRIVYIYTKLNNPQCQEYPVWCSEKILDNSLKVLENERKLTPSLCAVVILLKYRPKRCSKAIENFQFLREGGLPVIAIYGEHRNNAINISDPDRRRAEDFQIAPWRNVSVLVYFVWREWIILTCSSLFSCFGNLYIMPTLMYFALYKYFCRGGENFLQNIAFDFLFWFPRAAVNF